MTYLFPYGFGVDINNVETVTLPSANLYGGFSATSSFSASSKLVFALSSPQCSPTYLSSVTLVGSNITTITSWDNNSNPSSGNNMINFTLSQPGNNILAPAKITSFTFYPESTTQQQIISGQVYNYVVNIANGQSVSGSLIAQ